VTVTRGEGFGRTRSGGDAERLVGDSEQLSRTSRIKMGCLDLTGGSSQSNSRLGRYSGRKLRHGGSLIALTETPKPTHHPAAGGRLTSRCFQIFLCLLTAAVGESAVRLRSSRAGERGFKCSTTRHRLSIYGHKRRRPDEPIPPFTAGHCGQLPMACFR
jgi:hypothetical protein